MIILLVLLSIVLGSWCRGLFPLLTMLPLWCVFHSVLPNPSAIIGVNGYVYLLLDELLTKSSLDMDTWKMQKENILITWQTPVSVRALIGWLQVRGCRFKSWIFSSFTYFSNMLCAVKGFRPHGLLVYRLCLPPDTPIIFRRVIPFQLDFSVLLFQAGWGKSYCSFVTLRVVI